MAKGNAVSVRLSDALKEQLQQSAQATGRTMTQEIQERLAQSFRGVVDLETIAGLVHTNQGLAKEAATEIASTRRELTEIRESTVKVLHKLLEGELIVSR